MKKYKILNILVLAAASVSLAACGTIQGAGQDIETAGEAVQDAAHDASK